MNENRVFNYRFGDNDQITIQMVAGPITTFYLGEAINGTATTDKLWKIRRIIEDKTDPTNVITTQGVPLIDGIYEANGNCVRDDGLISSVNRFDLYTYSR